MASQPPARKSRRATSADVDRDEGRSWLSHGFAALGISALGLAVASSVALTTSAETTHASADAANNSQAAIAAPAQAPAAGRKPTKRASDAAKAFTPRSAVADPRARSAAVRKAIIKEQAAQRAEELAKSAEVASEADRAAAADARQKTLIEANEASRETAARLVQ